MRIRTKILMLVIPLTILPIVLLGFFSYRTMIEDFKRQLITEDQQRCLIASNRIEQVLDECRDGILFLSSPVGNQIEFLTKEKAGKNSFYNPANILSNIIEGEKNPFGITAQELAVRYSPYINIQVTGPDGKELFKCSADGQGRELGHISGELIFLPAVALSSINNNLFQLSPQLRNFRTTTFTKSFYGGSGENEFLAGFIFLDLDLKVFSKILNDVDKTTHGYYALIDGGKNIMAERENLFDDDNNNNRGEIENTIRSLLDNPKSEFVQYDFSFSGNRYYINMRPVKEYIASREPNPIEHWYLIYVHAETPLLATFQKSKLLFFIILGVGILTGIIGAVFISGKITTPLGKLAAAAREFAKGKLDSSVTISSRDEIGQLAGDLNYMAGELDKLIRERRTNEALIAIGKFSASLAHDLRNPVEGLKLLSKELCRRMNTNTPEYEIADTIVQSVDRLSNFLNQSLDFTRLAKPVFRETDITYLANSVLQDFQFTCNQIIKTFDENLPLIELDAPQIKRVFSNLIRNSIEACKQKFNLEMYMIVLKIQEYDAKIKIEISDNGEGIPVELQERIFEPFFSTKPQGHGLGLALARRIILNHGGSIALKSEVNIGTSFIIELPVKHSSE